MHTMKLLFFSLTKIKPNKSIKGLWTNSTGNWRDFLAVNFGIRPHHVTVYKKKWVIFLKNVVSIYYMFCSFTLHPENWTLHAVHNSGNWWSPLWSQDVISDGRSSSWIIYAVCCYSTQQIHHFVSTNLIFILRRYLILNNVAFIFFFLFCYESKSFYLRFNISSCNLYCHWVVI